MNNLKKYIISSFLLLLSIANYAQELNVKSFKENTKDLAARTNQRVDNNGTPCALVKVQLATSGAQFEGIVMGDVAYKTSEYWVYMPQGSKRLTVKTEGALPANVEFADYGVSSLVSNATYVMAMQVKGRLASSGFSTTPKVFSINGVEFTMIPVEGGKFKMGGVEQNELPVHEVELSNYYIGETEVTQELWEAVMGYNPSYYTGRKKPVTRVDIVQCEEFIRRLNLITGQTFALPTEAQWEYAARGGKHSKNFKYSGSNNIDDVAWYRYNATHQQEVKLKQQNELGIYDMTGNVWEWMGDDAEPYKEEPQKDPKGFIDGHSHFLKGGSQDNEPYRCRISNRGGANNDNSIWNGVGLRLAMQVSTNTINISNLTYTADYKSLQKSNISTFVFAGPEAWHKGTSNPPNWDGYEIDIQPNRKYRLFFEVLDVITWHVSIGGNEYKSGNGHSYIEFDSNNNTSLFPYVEGYNDNEFPQYHRLTLEILR